MSEAKTRQSALIWGLGTLTLALTLMALWKWTPLKNELDQRAVLGFVRDLRHSAWAPLVIIAVYVAASFVMFPNTILNFATIVGLGSVYGFSCALAGSMVASMVMYWLGRRYGSEKFKRLPLEKAEAVANHLRQGGTLAVFTARMLPIAPFPLVNLMGGVCRVKVRHFIFGTLLGLAPGMLLVALFGRQLRRVVEQTEWTEIALLGLTVTVALSFFYWLSRKARRASSPGTSLRPSRRSTVHKIA